MNQGGADGLDDQPTHEPPFVYTKMEQDSYEKILNMGTYGHNKMEIFKRKARAILGQTADDEQFVDNLDYNPS